MVNNMESNSEYPSAITLPPDTFKNCTNIKAEVSLFKYYNMETREILQKTIDRLIKDKEKLNQELREAENHITLLQEDEAKAAKWNALKEKLLALYGDDEDNPKEIDLCHVGELACIAFNVH